MTTLEQNKTFGIQAMGKRSSSLGKAFDMKDLKLQKILKQTQGPSLSFNNFKVVHTISHKNSILYSNASGPIQNTPLLPEINDNLPKALSPKLMPKNRLSEGTSHLTKALKGVDTDLLYYFSIRKPSKLTSFGHKNSASIDNGSISELKQKLGLESETNSKKGHHSSMMDIHKKQVNIEEKLPIKRRGLNKDIREIYRSIINSKDHGTYQELISKINDSKDNINARISKGHKTSQIESKIVNKEDDVQTIEETIKMRGMKEFQKKIALYNLTHGNYLVPPEERFNTKNQVGKIPKFTQIPKIELKNQRVTFNLLSKPSLGKSPQKDNATKTEVIQIIRNFEQGNKLDLGKISRRSKEKFFSGEKPKQISQASDIRRMRDLEEKIPKKKVLTEEEEAAFKAVKEGNERELWSLLETNPELINATDNRNQTLLHWAIKRGYYSIVICLCKKGADLDAIDMANRKPVDIAERLGTLEIIDYLKNHLKKKNELAQGLKI